MREFLAVALRLLLAAASLGGVVTQFVIAVRTDFGLVNFFSYFTTLSNIFASVIFIAGAIRILRRAPSTPLWEATRGSAVVYMAFVGIVFNTLLGDADLGGLLPWVNVVHHMLLPLAVVIDWLLLPPRSRQLYPLVDERNEPPGQTLVTFMRLESVGPVPASRTRRRVRLCQFALLVFSLRVSRVPCCKNFLEMR